MTEFSQGSSLAHSGDLLNIYPSGTTIPGFEGVIRNGITLTVAQPEHIRILQTLITVANQSSTTPLSLLYHVLNLRQFIDPDMIGPERFLSLVTLFAPSTDLSFPDWRETAYTEEMSDAEVLLLILSLAHEIWVKEEQPDSLHLALSLVDPSDPSHSVLQFEGQRSGLVLTRGSIASFVLEAIVSPESLIGSSVKYVAGVPRFAVSFFTKRGLGASTRADLIKEELRQRSLDSEAWKLPRLDYLTREELEQKAGVIILLHGFMGTDAGTFDALIRKWYDLSRSASLAKPLNVSPLCAWQCREEDYLIVGWPHDTFRSIEDNALELAELLETKLGVSQGRVAFVCHSRGGLVARKTAVQLIENKPAWAKRLVGCVTFGTPHEGTALAELATGRMVGHYLTLMRLRSPDCVIGINDLLTYQAQRKGFPGVEDLRPLGGGGEFLRNLKRQEQKQAPAGAVLSLDLFAIGGDTADASWPAGWVERVLGTPEHDLVIETKSSLPRFLDEKNRRKTQSDHTSYFVGGGNQVYDWLAAIEYLEHKLGFVDVLLSRCEATTLATAHIDQTEEVVIIEGIELPIN